MRALFALLLTSVIFVSASAGAEIKTPICEGGSLKVFIDFQGGNIDSCDVSSGGKITVQIAPEDEPINSSPWYAFRLASPVQVTVPVVLDYGTHKHRYTPDISIDGVAWQTYPSDRVSLSQDRNQAAFSIIVPASKSVVVAAQPLLTSSHYAHWLESLQSRYGLDVGSVGESIDGRPLWRVASPAKRHTLLLLGRQHPPETTGAIALMSFVERLFEEDELAERFREEVGVLLYPLINPDGVDKGYWRHNFQGKDLNREWGPLTQPENRAVDADVTQWLDDNESQLIKAIDFHSTRYEVFYTQADQTADRFPHLLGDWLLGFEKQMQSQFDGFEIRRQISKTPQLNAAKHYFFTQYGVSSTTLEMGDETDRKFVREYGRTAAEAFMRAYFQQVSANQPLDILFRGGVVVDGTGAAPYKGDIGIRDGRIVRLTGTQTPEAESEIDISGKVITPGFIDIHTHARADLVSPETAHMEHYLTQGVSTVVIGNDGDGATRIRHRFNQIFAHGAGTNVAQLVGHASLRRRVMDETGRPATEAEIAEMKTILSESLDEGALGLSTGLFYADGSHASTEEVIELARVASSHNAIYESHIRAESSRGVGVDAAVDEVIRIAREADIPAHIAHIKVLGKDVWGRSGDIIGKIRSAREEGLQISADQYPWVASSTQLKSAVVSSEYQVGGIDAIRNRLSDPELRELLLIDMAANIERRGGPTSLMLVETEDAQWHGLRLDAIASTMGVAPEVAAAHLIGEGRARVVSFNMIESDIEQFMREPWVATSSDGTDGHPRKYGSFPRKYDTYVRKRGTLSLTDFVRASSGLPAAILGLNDRGTLLHGHIADVLVFDPDRYREEAGFSNWNMLSRGVEYLVINGDFAVRDGEVTKQRLGRPLPR